jgi:hypothetical protein
VNEEERARTAPFDPDALEEFLQKFEPHQRALLLESFYRRPARASIPPGPREAESQATLNHPWLTGVSDPVLQEILERIWAPVWAFLSLEQLEKAGSDLPGLEIARQRARARRQDGR